MARTIWQEEKPEMIDPFNEAHVWTTAERRGNSKMIIYFKAQLTPFSSAGRPLRSPEMTQGHQKNPKSFLQSGMRNSSKRPHWSLKSFVFFRYDTGRDGFIDLMELKLMMEKLGAPQTHLGLKNMIKEVDEDFDGKLSFREVRDRTCADGLHIYDVNIGALLDWDLVTGDTTGA